MSDPGLDKLSNLENQIYDLGVKLSVLLDNIRDNFSNDKGKYLNDSTLELDDIFKMINYIRDEMHKQIEDVYKENNFQHLSKAHLDVLEKLNCLKDLKDRITLKD